MDFGEPFGKSLNKQTNKKNPKPTLRGLQPRWGSRPAGSWRQMPVGPVPVQELQAAAGAESMRGQPGARLGSAPPVQGAGGRGPGTPDSPALHAR